MELTNAFLQVLKNYGKLNLHNKPNFWAGWHAKWSWMWLNVCKLSFQHMSTMSKFMYEATYNHIEHKHKQYTNHIKTKNDIRVHVGGQRWNKNNVNKWKISSVIATFSRVMSRGSKKATRPAFCPMIFLMFKIFQLSCLHCCIVGMFDIWNNVKNNNSQTTHQQRYQRGPGPLQKDAPWKMLLESWFN